MAERTDLGLLIEVIMVIFKEKTSRTGSHFFEGLLVALQPSVHIFTYLGIKGHE